MSSILWSNHELDQLRKYVASGLDLKSISVKLGRSESSVEHKLRRGGLLLAKRLPPADPEASAPVETIFEKHERETREAELRRKLKEALADRATLIERQAILDDIQRFTGIYQVPSIVHPDRVRSMTLCAFGSDWHVEERVDKGRVTFSTNVYNPGVAEKRMAKFFEGLVWFKHHHEAGGDIKIDDCVLGLLGDLITGYIHEELMEGNFLSPVEAIIWLQERIVPHIRRLLDFFKTLTIVCVPGNHGRSTQKYKVATYCENSFEWMMYKNLEAIFASDERITFVVSKDNHQYVQVYSTKIHVAHFDDIKYNGGVGGVSIPLLKRVAIWNQGPQRADVHVGGHFHQYLDLGNVVCNSSLIGYNAYAQSIGARPEPAQQAMFMVDSERGKCLPGQVWCE